VCHGWGCHSKALPSSTGSSYRSVNLKTMRGQCSVEGLAFTSFTCLIIKNRICIYLVRLNLIIKVIICK
jgi:hypothetical protein